METQFRNMTDVTVSLVRRELMVLSLIQRRRGVRAITDDVGSLASNLERRPTRLNRTW